MIQLEKGATEKGAEKGDVFGRISKKRTEREGDHNPEGGHPKRFKKGTDQILEEVKVDPSNSVIDLSHHKNNIRLKKPDQEEEDLGDKKRIRCRHWPNCNNTDEECPYVHPKEDCPYFPKC